MGHLYVQNSRSQGGRGGKKEKKQFHKQRKKAKLDKKQFKISLSKINTLKACLKDKQLLRGNSEVGKEETFLCTHKNQSPDHWHAITETVMIYRHLARMMGKGKERKVGWREA